MRANGNGVFMRTDRTPSLKVLPIGRVLIAAAAASG